MKISNVLTKRSICTLSQTYFTFHSLLSLTSPFSVSISLESTDTSLRFS